MIDANGNPVFCKAIVVAGHIVTIGDIWAAVLIAFLAGGVLAIVSRRRT